MVNSFDILLITEPINVHLRQNYANSNCCPIQKGRFNHPIVYPFYCTENSSTHKIIYPTLVAIEFKKKRTG